MKSTAKKKGGKRRDSRYREVKDDWRSKAEFHELVAALGAARKVERSSSSNSASKISARETHSSPNLLFAVMEMTSSMTRQEDVTAR